MRKNKVLINNLFSLSVLQVASYIFPLITIPYLSRILSVEHFGLIMFSLAFNAYFALLCDYGFNLSATKEVAIYRHSPLKLNQLVSGVSLIKLYLFGVAVLINLIIVFSIRDFRQYWFIYSLNLIGILNNVFFPAWFFQGMEQMRFISLIQLIIRGSSAALILLFLNQDNEYYLWVVFTTFANFCGAVLAQVIMLNQFKIRYTRPKVSEIKHLFKDGWYVFISTVATSLYTISNSFFLGILTTMVMVAYYASAEKIISAIQGLLNPVTIAIFPYLSKAIYENQERGVKLLQKALFSLAFIGAIISISVYISAPLMVKLFLGVKYQNATIHILRILAILPFLVSISNILGIQTMLSFGLSKALSKIFIISGMVNIISTLILVPWLVYYGTAISVVITETIVTLSMAGYLYKYGIYVWQGKLAGPRFKVKL